MVSDGQSGRVNTHFGSGVAIGVVCEIPNMFDFLYSTQEVTSDMTPRVNTTSA